MSLSLKPLVVCLKPDVTYEHAKYCLPVVLNPKCCWVDLLTLQIIFDFWEVSDYLIVVMSTLPNSLTGSRSEYLMVVGIHSDG